MAERNNWFDDEFGDDMEKAPAEEALEIIANSPRVIQAVKDALATHDANSKKTGWAGPTRTQTIRNALAEVVQAQA